MKLEDSGQAGAEIELNFRDRQIITGWRAMGYSIPAPELTGKRLDNFLYRISAIEKRWHNL